MFSNVKGKQQRIYYCIWKPNGNPEINLPDYKCFYLSSRRLTGRPLPRLVRPAFFRSLFGLPFPLLVRPGKLSVREFWTSGRFWAAAADGRKSRERRVWWSDFRIEVWACQHPSLDWRGPLKYNAPICSRAAQEPRWKHSKQIRLCSVGY
jgi:hypothetical protein